MAAKDGEPKRALATGVNGEIAMALARRLRDAGWVVVPAERGDDLAKLATDV
jgi:NAD(P)-dependent dehydrogenase (short-subunit alcohol dehydrogenase family)